jgi:hypothetical protein
MKTTLQYYLLRIKHFPIALYFFIKKFNFSYLKQRGGMVLIVLILYFTNIIPFVFYKTILSLEEKRLYNIEKNLIEYKEKKSESIKNIKCFENQLYRIIKDESTNFSYCIK